MGTVGGLVKISLILTVSLTTLYAHHMGLQYTNCVQGLSTLGIFAYSPFDLNTYDVPIKQSCQEFEHGFTKSLLVVS